MPWHELGKKKTKKGKKEGGKQNQVNDRGGWKKEKKDPSKRGEGGALVQLKKEGGYVKRFGDTGRNSLARGRGGVPTGFFH